MLVVSGIRDRVADHYLGVDLSDNDKVACRNFVFAMARILTDREKFLGPLVDDYELWYLGQFDQETGVFYDLDNAHLLMLGVQARMELQEFEQDESED